MEKINLTKLIQDHRWDDETAESWLHWTLLALMGKKDIRDWIIPKGHKPGENIVVDVSMQINGQDVSFKHVIFRLAETFDKAIREQCEKMIQERVEEKWDIIQTRLDSLKDLIDNAADSCKQSLMKEFPDLESDTRRDQTKTRGLECD